MRPFSSPNIEEQDSGRASEDEFRKIRCLEGVWHCVD